MLESENVVIKNLMEVRVTSFVVNQKVVMRLEMKMVITSVFLDL
jgi:hypothetical protein